MPTAGRLEAIAPLLRQAEDLETPVLPEVMIKREGSRHATGVEHGERGHIAQRPVFVDLPRKNLLGALLLGRKDRDDGEVAGQ